jgi:hypothetical protein
MRRGSRASAPVAARRRKLPEKPDSTAMVDSSTGTPDTTAAVSTVSDSTGQPADSVETFSLKKMSPAAKIIAAAGTGIVVGGAVTFFLVKKYNEQEFEKPGIPDPPAPPDF